MSKKKHPTFTVAIVCFVAAMIGIGAVNEQKEMNTVPTAITATPQTAVPSITPTPTPTPIPTPSPTPVPTANTIAASSGDEEHMVWIPTNGGTKYHSNSSCSKMKNPQKVTAAQAKNSGYTPCKRCY